MSWTTAKADLRNLLSDGATDKLRYRKKILGRVDGVNTVFKTLEKRRLTNFKTETSANLGVFIEGVRLNEATEISADNAEVGEVTLVTAPTNGQFVEASYYLQWFLDAELDVFLLQAAQWLGFESADSIAPGLRPAATYYAAQEAYHKLAVRWSESLSEDFRLEDAPNEKCATPVQMYRQLAEDAKKKSVELRDQFYSGKGQEQKPSFRSLVGAVPRIVPQK